MSNTIHITGSTIGAMAVGEGATASSGGPSARGAGIYRLKFEGTGWTRESIARHLRGLALILEDPEHPVTTFAKEENGTSRAWTLTREPAK